MSQFVFLTASEKFVFSEGENLAQALAAIVADPQKGHGRIPSVVVSGGVAAFVNDMFEVTMTKEVGSGKFASVVDTGVLKFPLKSGLRLLSLEDLKTNDQAQLAEEAVKAFDSVLPKVEEAPKGATTRRHRGKNAA